MIVLLHGVGGRAAMWEAVQAHLSAAGHRSIALDLPGYGNNALALEPYDFAGLRDWLAEQLQAVQEPVVLVGQSFGGMIALDFAASDHSQPPCAPLKALVLMNTSPAFGKPGGDWQHQFVESRLAPLRAGKSMHDVALAVAPAMLGPAAQSGALEAAVNMMAAVSAQTYERAVRCLSGFDRRSSLSQLGLPVLCLAGQADTTAPASVMEKMASFIPNSTFVSVPSIGHLLPLEAPRACALALHDFLTTHAI